MAESKPDAGEEAALGSFVFFLAPTERFPLLIRGLQKSDSAFEESGGFPAGEESDRAHDEAENRDPEIDELPFAAVVFHDGLPNKPKDQRAQPRQLFRARASEAST